ncbi:hypothetical protein [Azospirillum baldaniorum]|uniref:hypothetical protein n=1 Tax=Azospirillum baldaniorum TaxID=1064539 RepID=UPI001645E306|nr:hypothetical protein [Azospirillum baldaniorum]
MKILIVDDAENVRYSLRTSLEDAGYTVDEAVDGEEALRAPNRTISGRSASR